MESTITKKRRAIVCVEGNIGSGKSSFLETFNHDPRIKTFFEPLDKWMNYNGENLLRESYENPKEKSFLFQVCNFVTMIHRDRDMNKYLIENARKEIVLTERWFFSGSDVFVPNNIIAGNLTHYEGKLLEELSEVMSGIPVRPDMIIYIDTAPKTCQERIKIRNREGESKLTLETLSTLDGLFKKMQNNDRTKMYDIPLCILDGNKNTEELIKEFEYKALPMIENILLQLNEKEDEYFEKELEEDINNACLDISHSHQRRSSFWEYIPFIKHIISFLIYLGKWNVKKENKVHNE